MSKTQFLPIGFDPPYEMLAVEDVVKQRAAEMPEAKKWSHAKKLALAWDDPESIEVLEGAALALLKALSSGRLQAYTHLPHTGQFYKVPRSCWQDERTGQLNAAYLFGELEMPAFGADNSPEFESEFIKRQITLISSQASAWVAQELRSRGSLQLPRIAPSQLKGWLQELGPAGRQLKYEELVRQAQGAHPQHRVPRDLLKELCVELDGPRKRGPKPISG